MASIPDYGKSEEWIIRTTLKERYGEDIPFEYADAEIRLSPADRDLSTCPVVFWEKDNCNFVIFKSGDRRYRCQFFYHGYQQYGTGIHEYDDLSECIVSLLQTQADHQAKEQGKI
ncbi:hypothetical protein [Thiolapillus brandeum]|uniref:Uncharacterized protein n=1 Tax=Thiolapillus brandeum TaxID=1076588 RepID=A0A7U6GG82_9GAMM|nr:hypothetical protein [Thiolapillus brandeum]BAO43053.1 conserved hypothetical protein [Thiolapillus brandeum]